MKQANISSSPDFIHRITRKAAAPLALAAFILLFTLLIHTALGANRIGADFYIFWRAGRAFLVDHANPYSEQVAAQIQQDILGRAAHAGEDHLAFAYPFYSLFGLLPTLLVSYDWALSFWYALNLTCLFTVLYLIFPGPAKITSLSVLLLFPVAFGLVMGNFSLPITTILLLFLGMFVLRGSRSTGLQVAAGILLAWATLKPQLIWLLLVFILLFAWKEKLRPFLVSFFSSASLFGLLSFILLHNWVQSWMHIVQWYAAYQQVSPVMMDLLRFILPAPAAGIAGWVLLAFCWFAAIALLVRWWQGRISWLQALAWLGLTTFLFHPHGMSYEQLPSLIPMILWIAQEGGRMPREKKFFWWAAILVSWLPLFFRSNTPTLDRAPVLWTAVWALWLLFHKPQSEPARIPDFQPPA